MISEFRWSNYPTTQILVKLPPKLGFIFFLVAICLCPIMLDIHVLDLFFTVFQSIDTSLAKTIFISTVNCKHSKIITYFRYSYNRKSEKKSDNTIGFRTLENPRTQVLEELYALGKVLVF